MTTKKTKQTQIKAYNRFISGYYNKKTVSDSVLRQAKMGAKILGKPFLSPKKSIPIKSIPKKSIPFKKSTVKPLSSIKPKWKHLPTIVSSIKKPVQIQTFKSVNNRKSDVHRKFKKIIDMHTQYIQQNKVKASYITVALKSRKYGLYRNYKYKIPVNINTKTRMKKFINGCVSNARKKLPITDKRISKVILNIDEVY